MGQSDVQEQIHNVTPGSILYSVTLAELGTSSFATPAEMKEILAGYTVSLKQEEGEADGPQLLRYGTCLPGQNGHCFRGSLQVADGPKSDSESCNKTIIDTAFVLGTWLCPDTK